MLWAIKKFNITQSHTKNYGVDGSSSPSKKTSNIKNAHEKIKDFLILTFFLHMGKINSCVQTSMAHFLLDLIQIWFQVALGHIFNAPARILSYLLNYAFRERNPKSLQKWTLSDFLENQKTICIYSDHVFHAPSTSLTS